MAFDNNKADSTNPFDASSIRITPATPPVATPEPERTEKGGEGGEGGAVVVSNADFLAIIFPDRLPDEEMTICAKQGDPTQRPQPRLSMMIWTPASCHMAR